MPFISLTFIVLVEPQDLNVFMYYTFISDILITLGTIVFPPFFTIIFCAFVYIVKQSISKK